MFRVTSILSLALALASHAATFPVFPGTDALTVQWATNVTAHGGTYSGRGMGAVNRAAKKLLWQGLTNNLVRFNPIAAEELAGSLCLVVPTGAADTYSTSNSVYSGYTLKRSSNGNAYQAAFPSLTLPILIVSDKAWGGFSVDTTIAIGAAFGFGESRIFPGGYYSYAFTSGTSTATYTNAAYLTGARLGFQQTATGNTLWRDNSTIASGVGVIVPAADTWSYYGGPISGGGLRSYLLFNSPTTAQIGQLDKILAELDTELGR